MALSNNLKSIMTGILIVMPLALLSYFSGPRRLPQREEYTSLAFSGVIVEKSRAAGGTAFIIEVRPGVQERFCCIPPYLFNYASTGDLVIKSKGTLNGLLIHNGDTIEHEMFLVTDGS